MGLDYESTIHISPTQPIILHWCDLEVLNANIFLLRMFLMDTHISYKVCKLANILILATMLLWIYAF